MTHTIPHTPIRVARAQLSPASPGGWWPCAFCQRDYPIHDGWLVDHYHEPTRQVVRSYVCPACAAEARSSL